MKKQLLYYTDNTLENTKLCLEVRNILNNINLPIISISHRPINFGENYIYKGKRGIQAILEQIWMGLLKSTADMVYFVEHDCLYHSSHFELISEILAYDDNWYRCSERGFFTYNTFYSRLLSTCFGPRIKLIEGIASKLAYLYKHNTLKFFEPGLGTETRFIDYKRMKAKCPMICVRHNKNFGIKDINHLGTPNNPTWGNYKKLREKLGLDL